MKDRITIILIMALVVTGCCTNVSRDPREGGLLGGVCGTTTGTYQARIDEREATVASLSAERTREEQRQASLQAEERAMRGKVNAMQRELSDLQRQVDAATATTSAQRSKQGQISRALAQKQAELNRLKAQSLGTDEQRRKIAELDAEVKALANVYFQL